MHNRNKGRNSQLPHLSNVNLRRLILTCAFIVAIAFAVWWVFAPRQFDFQTTFTMSDNGRDRSISSRLSFKVNENDVELEAKAAVLELQNGKYLIAALYSDQVVSFFQQNRNSQAILTPWKLIVHAYQGVIQDGETLEDAFSDAHSHDRLVPVTLEALPTMYIADCSSSDFGIAQKSLQDLTAMGLYFSKFTIQPRKSRNGEIDESFYDSQCWSKLKKVIAQKAINRDKFISEFY